MLKIPDQHLGVLKRLVALSPTERVAIGNAIAEAPPKLQLIELSRSVAASLGRSPQELAGIVGMLASMYEATSRMKASPQKFAADVLEALRASEEVGEYSAISDDIEAWLARMLSAHRSLGVTSKAVDVMSDHERVFDSVRILTDVRPIFVGADVETPSALTIVHTLRISHKGHTKDGTRGAYYVALDARDIDRLIECAQRAKQKEAALRTKVVVPDGDILFLSLGEETKS